MSAPLSPEDQYEVHTRRLCIQCGHAFVWHGIGVGDVVDPDLYVPEGCGVRGCTCDRIDPEGA